MNSGERRAKAAGGRRRSRDRSEPAGPGGGGPAAGGEGSRLRRWLGTPVDGAAVAFFRVAFGLLMAGDAAAMLLGRLDRLYLAPVFRFTYPGFEWVAPLPAAGLRALFAVLLGCALALALGRFARVAAVAFAAGWGYVFLLDAAAYNNHDYLICLLALLFGLAPLPGRGVAAVPRWSLLLFRFQVAVPYFLGGVAKLNADWLLRAQPMRLWLSEGADGVTLPAWLRGEAAAWGMSWGGAVFDLAVVPLLLVRRTRPFALAAVVLFHLTNVVLFKIGVFPWLMLAATMLFLPPEWSRRLRWAGRAPVPAAGSLRAASPAAVALLTAWIAVQAALPFRHLLYPGPVDWTEEGHRFAWRMKLRDKRGDVHFLAVPRSGGSTAIALEGLDQFLTSRQLRMMEHDPDMIRQVAVHLAEGLRSRGDFAVRAITSISFNGRAAQPLVRPDADLVQVERGAGGYGIWIESLRDP